MTEFPEKSEAWALVPNDDGSMSSAHISYFVDAKAKVRELYASYNHIDPDDENCFEVLGLAALQNFCEWIAAQPDWVEGNDDTRLSFQIDGHTVRKVCLQEDPEAKLKEIFIKATREDAEDESSIYNLSFCAGYDLMYWLKGQGEAMSEVVRNNGELTTIKV
ncbi:hypothetical protein ACI2KR_27225 [Pseudomonas luteola]